MRSNALKTQNVTKTDSAMKASKPAAHHAELTLVTLPDVKTAILNEPVSVDYEQFLTQYGIRSVFA